MRFGTIVRLLILLCIIACPWTIVFLTHDWDYIGLIGLYLFIPLFFVWEMACSDCDACFMSGYCSKTKKANFIKSILLFFGYDKEKLDKINNYEDTLNHYWNIFTYINKLYHNM